MSLTTVNRRPAQVTTIATEIYGAADVAFSKAAKNKLKRFERQARPAIHCCTPTIRSEQLHELQLLISEIIGQFIHKAFPGTIPGK